MPYTASATLHELMMRLGVEAEYVCINQRGPQHRTKFEFMCKALNMQATGVAGTKKGAKQKAAKALLAKLAQRGYPVPAPFGLTTFEEDIQIARRVEEATHSQVAMNINNAAKSAAAVLQELMVKILMAPEYQCISRSGPQHSPRFEYRCSAIGETAKAKGRTKQEAKQGAARILLAKLAHRGYAVPEPWGLLATQAPEESEDGSSAGTSDVEDDNIEGASDSHDDTHDISLAEVMSCLE